MTTVLAGLIPALVALVVWGGSRLARPPTRRVSPRSAARYDRAVARRTRRPVIGRSVGSGLFAIVVALVVAIGAGVLPAIAVLVFLLVLAPRWRTMRTRKAATRAVVSDLADTIDLLVVLIRSGLTPMQSIGMLAQRAPPSWRPGFAAVEDARQRGIRFVDALDELVIAVGAPGGGIVHALSSAERYGHPLGPTLERLADEGRAARRRQAEAEARQLPVRLSFPLVCCTLPSFVLLTIAPLLAGAFSSLSLSGGPP